MSGKSARDKGQRGEREFKKLTNGVKVPGSGAAEGYSNDVVAYGGLQFEVKRRKSGFKQLYDWIEDTRENPDAVALRTDGKQWIVCMTLSKFDELMKERKE